MDLKGPKTLIVEESHIAQWIKSVLEPYVDKLIVNTPSMSREDELTVLLFLVVTKST